MIAVTFDDREFVKKFSNLANYALGFLEGAVAGKMQFLHSLGLEMKQMVLEYIDASARSNPGSLHHVYEWYQTGSPDARLYDIDYKASGAGLSFNYTFSQSTSIQRGSNVPFYDKARIMENGIPVTIRPKKADVLVFEADGRTIFTKNPVRVDNPGGNAEGQFAKTFESFFSRYFTQAFLQTSGIMSYLQEARDFRRYVIAGMNSGGKSLGFRIGYRWIAKAGELG